MLARPVKSWPRLQRENDVIEVRTLMRFHVTRDATGEDIVKHEYIEVQIRWPSGGEPGPRPDSSPTRWQLIEKQSKEKPNE